ncbi:probable multidrug resistance-associated protein lethal(2)03659 [Anoplophora glabripennis]|uniref:probable multidrug resistance-associated protein lethal(2)03659 n=1 Tax=Anoplophora glabripennis TaxID=217634 RepID=UPI00087378B7|nr:probable multidrug resistance-associated protein lethal(2)03659 [Anoplophora glabripennis]
MEHCEKIERKTNPRENANLLSLLTFVYTGQLFSKAYKHDLEEEDIYEVIKSCGSEKCGDKLEKCFNTEKQRKKPSTARMIWKCYGTTYIGLGMIHLCFKLVNSVLEPEAIGKLVSYFKPKQTTVTIYDAMYYAGIMIGLKILHCFYFQNYMIYLKQLAIQIRTAFCSLIYRKTLKLTPSALLDVSVGNIITIVTKDVQQFESTIWLFNELWIALIQTAVICYLLYSKIGIASAVGITLLLLSIPLQLYIGKVIKRMRLKINRKTDERLQVTQESLSAIKIIKMYTWEKIFGQKIDFARKREMKQLMTAFYLKIVMSLITMLSSKIGFYCLVVTYIWLNESTSADVMFYIMKCFVTLKHVIGHTVSDGMSRMAELSASLDRINRVLRAEELKEATETNVEDPTVFLKNARVCIKDKTVLENITVSLQKGLTVITGPLGCGKSSLVKTILQDYPLSGGIVETSGRKSYASQDPWLFPSSIKQNILFGEEYNEKRYQEVVRRCALEYDFKLLPNGDETIVADKGLNLSKGQQARINLARAVYKDADIYLVDDSLTALDPQVQDFIFQECIKRFLKGKLCILVTHNAKHINSADRVVILENGTIKFQGNEDNLPNDILSNIEDTNVKDGTKKVVENEIIEDEKTVLLKSERNLRKKGVYFETKKEGSVSGDVYWKYFKFGGGILLFGLIILLFSACQFTESYTSKLLSHWVNVQQNITSYKEAKGQDSQTTGLLEEYATNSNSTLRMYSVMIFSFITLELIKTYFVLTFARRASVKLHKTMVDSILFSVMQFFDSHFIGNILNRFAQDLNVVDERLPLVLNRLIEVMFAVGGIVILIAVVNWKFFLPSLALIVTLMACRNIYMPAARSLRRLESASRSPIVGHLNASVDGLTTIRASRAERILTKEFDRHQDLYTSAHYTSFCLKRAFAFCMDVTSTIFVCIIIIKFLFLDSGTAAGDVGLAITQAASLSMIIQGGLMQWSELENLMTSVERVLEYTKLDIENPTGQEVEKWPSLGAIKYINVSLTYSNTNEKVLKSINFHVKPRQKIGIVGRTGAGKTSIISTLFRLYNYEGQILIDDVELKTIPLTFLRQHISIIPQDPIMFAGTIRTNIDPLQLYTDKKIWKTIHKARLQNVIHSLDLRITSNNSNFSTGQRQLICLARAIIRSNKIVVLDEATANMDPETELLIQKVIAENFVNCTVLIIAHRLNSVLSCDKVMVMEKGVIKEFDNPITLLHDKTSMFSKMLQNTTD